MVEKVILFSNCVMISWCVCDTFQYFKYHLIFDVPDVHGRPGLHVRREGERLQGVHFNNHI